VKKRSTWSIVAVILALVVIATSFAACKGSSQTSSSTATSTSSTSTTKTATVTIGYDGPLTGGASAWGIPEHAANQAWADYVNEKGGIKVGDTVYKINYVAGDNEGDPAKALTVARKLVLEDKAVMMGSLIASRDIAPFLTEQKVFEATTASYTLSSKYPYLAEVGLVDPTGYALSMDWILTQSNLNLKKVAIVYMDNELGKGCDDWWYAAAKVAGADVVFHKSFPDTSTDLAPLITAVLATKPDLICFGTTYGNFMTMMWEQVYVQGYTGKVIGCAFDYPGAKAKVGDFINGRGYNQHPNLSDPAIQALDPRYPEIYKKIESKYGTVLGWDSVACALRRMIQYQTLVEKTQSWDAAVIMEKSHQPGFTIDTDLGPAKWMGKEWCGIDNDLWNKNYPINIVENWNGKSVAMADLWSWWDAKGSAILAELAKIPGAIHN
jgi:branched-chain amino acid transport system substrate-binding protein